MISSDANTKAKRKPPVQKKTPPRKAKSQPQAYGESNNALVDAKDGDEGDDDIMRNEKIPERRLTEQKGTTPEIKKDPKIPRRSANNARDLIVKGDKTVHELKGKPNAEIVPKIPRRLNESTSELSVRSKPRDGEVFKSRGGEGPIPKRSDDRRRRTTRRQVEPVHRSEEASLTRKELSRDDGDGVPSVIADDRSGLLSSNGLLDDKIEDMDTPSPMTDVESDEVGERNDAKVPNEEVSNGNKSEFIRDQLGEDF